MAGTLARIAPATAVFASGRYGFRAPVDYSATPAVPVEGAGGLEIDSKRRSGVLGSAANRPRTSIRNGREHGAPTPKVGPAWSDGRGTDPAGQS